MLIAGLAAALTVTSAWAQDATYALPTTTVTVQVEIRQDNFFAGPYASFAHRMLNMEAEENDSVTSSLVSARLIPSVEADPSAWYTCDAESAALLSLSAQGLIALTDAGKERQTQWRFLPGLGKDFSRSGLTGPDKPVTRIEYKTVQTDTAEITVPVEHRVLVDKTLEDKAADAADMILNVRRDRLNIASGNTDASYSGEAMGAALRELDRIEKEYLSLFRGYTVSRTYTASFDIRPVAADPEGAAALRARFPGKTLLLSIGRLVPYKGYPVLIRAMKHLPENYHLIIGGNGPLRDELEALIGSENLRERISLVGYLAEEELPAWYGACEVFVLSSVMKTEAFGIVQIEAMSAGKPVVATKIPGSGVPWVNEDGVSGRNVTPGDPAELAAAIEDVIDHYGSFSAGARARYETLFREQTMIQSIFKLYEALV